MKKSKGKRSAATRKRKTYKRKGQSKRKTQRRFKKVSEFLERGFPTLKRIARDPNIESRRRRLLKASKRKDVCYGLKELALNKLKGNLNFGNKSSYPGNQDLIRLIATTKDRRNLENLTSQSGGILPFLIPAAAATLGGLLKNVLF